MVWIAAQARGAGARSKGGRVEIFYISLNIRGVKPDNALRFKQLINGMETASRGAPLGGDDSNPRRSPA
jgi:hypothetical protein